MDEPPKLSLGSMHLDIASALYAGNPEIASTAAALSRVLGPPPTLPHLQPPVQRLQLLWPSVILHTATAVKHPMPFPTLPPAKKLQVLRTSSSVLTPALPIPEALPTVKFPLPKLQVHRPLPKLQVRRPLRQASSVLGQESLKEMPVISPIPAASFNLMLDSQKLWIEMLSGSKDKTLTGIKNCKCKNSKYLKLYCECFANRRYCKDCNCRDCYNNSNHKNARARYDAINSILKRRPMAFMPKVWRRSCVEQNSEEKAAEGPLGDNCTCGECKNYESNEDRKAVYRIAQKRHTVFVQNKLDYAFRGIIGPSSVLPHTTENDLAITMASSASHHPIRNSGPLQPLLHVPTYVPIEDNRILDSEIDTKSISKTGSHEVTYRPLLAGIIKMEDVNELCELLIIASRRAAEASIDPGMKDNTNTDSLDRAESCLSYTNYDREVFLKTLDKQECLQESNCDGRSDNNRPLSPGSQALICDERDLVLQLSRNEDAINLTMTHSLPGIFIEQEKHVLTNFRDYLCKLANCGRRQGEELASMSTSTMNKLPMT
ncbi:hypothetical protein BS78_07G118900 [Paspalum vaginatum]|nr:hypothetical protein BS78_07G118900 [Paspalum vaginatum]